MKEYRAVYSESAAEFILSLSKRRQRKLVNICTMTKLLLFAYFFAACLHASVAQEGDPRAVEFTTWYEPADPKIKSLRERVGTSQSIAIYGAFDEVGQYHIAGVERGLKLTELKAVIRKFYAEFPKDDAVQGHSIPLPNILYCSRSWAELKKEGQEFVLGIAKEFSVSAYWFSINADYETRKVKRSGLTDTRSIDIEYYDHRLAAIAKELFPDTPPAK